ncbi:LLM class flavin-dependent oxidoreductase [Staphylococcus sp. HKU1]|uniref:LLM class flavin-dependent oxidoreductase n=1 Tax=unclassified Staphylococcus TaxID=91994 RepID=UPI00203EB118|nr:LLM class flavin-dependent oxidoreductase [Staphylococcus sp. Marseille-Q6910]
MAQLDINANKPLEFGLYSLGDHLLNPENGEKVSYQQRIQELIEASQLAEQAGIDVFAVGESHQEHFTTQAHTVLLGAIAQATKNIKISSSSTILSASDPVRVFEDFATLDLISQGRAEVVAGRGSRTRLFDLFGLDINDYEALFEEKLELLLELNKHDKITWSGEFRPPLKNMKIFPRPVDNTLPIWRAVGGGPGSAIKAGQQGVPMMITTLGGPATVFKDSIDVYRQTAKEHGFDTSPSSLPVSTASLFYTAKTTQEALKNYYPHLNVGMSFIRGAGYPKQQFDQSPDHREALMVGSTQQIVEKILYQHELYNHQRFMAQIDFGGVPFDQIMKNIELIGNDIIPQVNKHLKNK